MVSAERSSYNTTKKIARRGGKLTIKSIRRVVVHQNSVQHIPSLHDHTLPHDQKPLVNLQAPALLATNINSINRSTSIRLRFMSRVETQQAIGGFAQVRRNVGVRVARAFCGSNGGDVGGEVDVVGKGVIGLLEGEGGVDGVGCAIVGCYGCGGGS